MRTIAIEEHFLTTSFLKAIGDRDVAVRPEFQQTQAKLIDLGKGRIADMDEAGISMQVLSLATSGLDGLAAVDAVPIVRDVNDELAQAISANPDRLAGFAAVALLNPDAAAQELARCVQKLGFKGAMVDGTVGGEFLDQAKFLPFFEAAQALGVPIYLHPAPPPHSVRDAYFSGLPGQTGFLLSIAGWGWHAETGLHILRLIVSGLFERFPELQIIIGHMGEGVPYALARSSAVLSTAMPNRTQSVSETFLQNVHITTSGYFTRPPFQCALDVVGIQRLLFSVDYPFSSNTKGRGFLDTLDLDNGDLERLCYRNAQSLLQL